MDVRILFSKPDAVYLAGADVEGQLVVTFRVKKKVKEISLQLFGAAHISFRESAGMPFLVTKRTHYLHNEEIIKEKVVFFHNEGLSTMELKEYRYNFKFELSDTLPSSLYTEYGYIRYWVDVIIQEKKSSRKFKELLTILAPDLCPPKMTEFRGVIIPVTQTGLYFDSGCCSFMSNILGLVKWITCTVSIPKIEYKYGEKIRMRTKIVYKDKWQVYLVRTTLLQIAKFTGSDHQVRHISVKKVVENSFQTQIDSFEHTITVPKVPQSGKLLDQIEVGYAIKVEIRLKLRCAMLSIEIPITLHAPNRTPKLIKFSRLRKPILTDSEDTSDDSSEDGPASI